MADAPQTEKTATSQAMTCHSCKTEIRDQYFAFNGQIYCAACAAGLQRSIPASGTSAIRFAKAAVLGLVAAIAGAAVYAGVKIGANSEWALISIGMGWLVGTAVRYGSGNRGGWRYQVLAVFLTYTSISAAYAAIVWNEIGKPTGPEIKALALKMFALPYMDGEQSAIGWLIIGFGVFQAWKMNQPMKVPVSGPHSVSAATA